MQLPLGAPEQRHTQWLASQLRLFARSGALVVPRGVDEGGGGGSSAGAGGGGLLGRRVGFMLQEAMQVAGPRNTLLTVPPGMYQVCHKLVAPAGSPLTAACRQCFCVPLDRHSHVAAATHGIPSYTGHGCQVPGQQLPGGAL
jgi:hypothetical protein